MIATGNQIALPMTTALVVIAVLMVGTWIISVIKKNASIVDIVWGLGFVLVAWAVRLRIDGDSTRQNLLVAMTSIWGLRLSGYLAWRNHGKGEDFRYRAMRKQWGSKFPLVSLLTVFVLQGTIMFVVSLAVQLGQGTSDSSATWLLAVGVLVWAVGLFFEVVGDAQLTRFKAHPANAGVTMTSGLWKYTRHPNYFGDACVWWGIALVACETSVGRYGLIGAAVMTLFLRRVSGVTLLEKSLVKRRAGYDEYIARTSPFIPLPPKRK